MNLKKKRILVAPLNWGLGHATRCIPIIKALQHYGYEPIIASDGIALKLLEKEFPEVKTFELPSYGITYAKKGRWFKMKILQNSPKLLKAIKAEKKATKQLVEDLKLDGIISDNRLGVYSKQLPCAFVTHQLNVLSGSTSWFSTKIHQKFIKKFNECWVPDNIDEPNLTGKLGHVNNFGIPLKYIGPISRFEVKKAPLKYDVLVLISGPEPQRTMLEDRLLRVFEHHNKLVLFVKGLIQKAQEKEVQNQLTIYNFMTSEQLEKAINESNYVISRSGYTTIMDLAKLGKKAFFIPTPGQFEQEYLAKMLDAQKLVPTCNQDEFTLEKLLEIDHYAGLSNLAYDINFKKLFGLF
ncbi:MAG TPA: glycosyltransferase [Flavobacteriaceae bacterium]|nr:glycosyltransferase [Flavobacteriaceae bacterium]